MKTLTYDLPAHWVCPLEYGPDSHGDMSESEVLEFERFCDNVADDIGNCQPIEYGDDTGDFRRYHDATAYGVSACNVVPVTFMVTK